MLKLTKKADYGLMAMKHLAEHVDHGACSAKDVAEAYGIPQEALAKILQRLAKVGLVRSQHGTHGGYTLTRDPKMISAFEVIKAIDGPLFITSCVTATCRLAGCSWQNLTALTRFPAHYGRSRPRPNTDRYRTDNSALPIEGRMDKNCPICFGTGWVCEDHLDRAWS